MGRRVNHEPSAGILRGVGHLGAHQRGIAQGKNRSGLNWFLLSLLLGPIATFVLVAFYDKEPTNLPSKRSDRETPG